MEKHRATVAFPQLTEALMKPDGLSSVHQRLDSTHVISDIAVLSRLGLFTETVANLLRELRKDLPGKLATLDAPLLRRYVAREGCFADATREHASRRLVVVAQDLYHLVRTSESDAGWPPSPPSCSWYGSSASSVTSWWARPKRRPRCR